MGTSALETEIMIVVIVVVIAVVIFRSNNIARQLYGDVEMKR